MLLSVIIPYYNADAWIGKMLDSLMDQDLDPSDYEIIVVDDESSQEPATLKDYVNRYPQITYHKVPHGGQALARNYGLSVAKGEWICFADADDFVQPQVFGGVLRVAQEHDLEMIVAHSFKVDENGPVTSRRRNFSSMSDVITGLEYLANLRSYFIWLIGAFWIKRSVIVDNGIVYEDVDFAEDRLFTLALLQKVSRVASIDVDLYYYVQRESSFFHIKRKREIPAFLAGFFCFVDRLAVLADKPDTPPQVAEALNERRWRTAFYMLKNAFLYSPAPVNASCIARMERSGMYPIPIDKARDSHRTRFIKWLMNHRCLWLFLNRVFHLLPDQYIYKHFNV